MGSAQCIDGEIGRMSVAVSNGRGLGWTILRILGVTSHLPAFTVPRIPMGGGVLLLETFVCGGWQHLWLSELYLLGNCTSLQMSIYIVRAASPTVFSRLIRGSLIESKIFF